MTKRFRKALSLLLCLVMCLSLFPTAVFAEETNGSAVGTPTVETDIKGVNSVGTMLANTLDNSESENVGSPYVISDVVVEGQTATVEYVTDCDAEVLVAIYEEDGIRMLGSGG